MHSGIHYKVETFVVSLVDTSSGSPSSSTVQEKDEVTAPPEKRVHMTEQTEKVTTKEKNEVNEKISELEAKRKIETLARLRKTVTVSAAKSTSGPSALTSGKGSDYLSLIGGKIHQQWIFPETTDKDLLAIIHIGIAKNGSITILGFEKKSGNVLFDRAAIRAITSASPLPPPTMEMEIYFKFSP